MSYFASDPPYAHTLVMSDAKSRLSGLLGHFVGAAPPPRFEHQINFHTLSPTFFLPRAAAIEPEVSLFPFFFSFERLYTFMHI